MLNAKNYRSVIMSKCGPLSLVKIYELKDSTQK